MADDHRVFGSLKPMRDLVDIRITNDFQSIAALHEHLEQINLQDPVHLRPDWDTYFMVCESWNCIPYGSIINRNWLPWLLGDPTA